jgi:glutathione S-transferase
MKDSDLDSMSTTTLKEIRAEVIAYTSLIEEKLYPCLVHHLWLNDQNYAVTKQEFFKNTPFLMRWFYSPLLRRQYADYVRRMESKERKVAEDRAKECLSALSVLLGNKPYFYGETYVFSFHTNI